VLHQAQLKEKYKAELKSTALSTPEGAQGITFTGAKTIKVPQVDVGGFKDHNRNSGFNSGNVDLDWQTMTLAHDRDIEFLVDAMDVDETNQALSAANITNLFLTEQAIPEQDAYRFSKLYAEWVAAGGTADTTALTAANVLQKFDTAMEAMDDNEVPEEGRILYVTAAVDKLLKTADGISRSINVSQNSGDASRALRSIDDVQIVKVPSARFKTVYDWTDGFVPGGSAKQINMILVHPKSVIATVKHSYIKLWPEGTHTKGDGWLYQNRCYSDLFVIARRKDGIWINTAA
jgi:hypothetical protein